MIAEQLLDGWRIPDLKVVPHGVHERRAVEAIPAHDVPFYADQVLENLHLALARREMLQRQQTITFERQFNQSLQGVTWPASLQTITLGAFFRKTRRRRTTTPGTDAAESDSTMDAI